MLRREDGLVLQLQRHLAEREVRLQGEQYARLIVGQPHPGVGPLGEDAAAVRNLRTHDDGIPLPARDAHAVVAEHLHDHRIALRSEVAPVFVALALRERHGADPVEEGGTHRRGTALSRPATAGAALSRPDSGFYREAGRVTAPP